jgi:hypothetical protein
MLQIYYTKIHDVKPLFFIFYFLISGGLGSHTVANRRVVSLVVIHVILHHSMHWLAKDDLKANSPCDLKKQARDHQ